MFESAAKRVHLGRSVAFFGAGFSRDAKNLNNNEMAAANGLAKALSDALGESETLPLELAAQEYIKRRLQPDIREYIRKEYTATSIAPYQQHLSSLPWQRLYTTNYDNVIEKGRRDSQKGSLSATVLDSPPDFSGKVR